MRESFVLYTEYAKHLERLSMEQRGELLTAIFAYQMGNKITKLDDITGMAFDFISSQLDRDNLKYDETCRKRSKAGKLGGRPKKVVPVEKQVEAKKANGFSEKQVQAKKADNDNEDDNENADENDDVSEKRPTLPRKKFVPPTLDGIETYCAENGYHIDAQHFISYYTANGWKVGKNPMKDWQAAVRMWAMRDAHGGGFSKRNDGDILSDAVEACRRYEWEEGGGGDVGVFG